MLSDSASDLLQFAPKNMSEFHVFTLGESIIDDIKKMVERNLIPTV